MEKIEFKGGYKFLNESDFNKLTDSKDVNIIKIGNIVYIKFRYDLSDLGNEIGLNIGHYISDDLGYEKDDFISGFEHGVSIIDGTH
jgi:hypothetical protein